MTPDSIAALALQVLREAGPNGLAVPILLERVSARRGRDIAASSLLSALADFRNTHPDGDSLVYEKGRTKRFVLVEDPALDEAPAPLARPFATHPTLTAALCGDPLPGRSALDRRNNRAEARA